MHDSNLEPRTSAQTSAADRLREIESLLHQAQSGEMDESDALVRIAAVARGGASTQVYQKPWG